MIKIINFLEFRSLLRFNKRTLRVLLPLLLVLVLTTNCNKEDDNDRLFPQKVFMKKITLSNYPEFKPNGLPWDLDSAPDITILMNDESGQTIQHIVQTDTIINAVLDSTYSFVFTPPIEFPNPETFYRISVHDIDPNFWDYEVMDSGLNKFVSKNISYSPSDTIETWLNYTNGFEITYEVLYEF